MLFDKLKRLKPSIRIINAASVDFNFYAESSSTYSEYKISKQLLFSESIQTKRPINYINQIGMTDDLVDVFSAYFFYNRFIKTYHLKVSSLLIFNSNRDELKKLLNNKIK